MKNILLILAAAIMLTACGGNSRQKTTAGVPDMHNAENALDYQGTYKGVFPAADCPGIEIELTLHNDNTYTMNSSYMDRSEEPIQQTGNYTVKGNLLTLRAKVGIGFPPPSTTRWRKTACAVLMQRSSLSPENSQTNTYSPNNQIPWIK